MLQEQSKEDAALSRKAVSQKVQEVFVRFSSILKTAQIYDPSNLTFKEQLGPLHALLQDILREEGQALFQFQENTLFFNNNRIKFDFASYNHFKSLAREFRKKECGIIEFEPGIDEEELSKFIVLLATFREEKESSFEDFQRELEARRIDHVSLSRLHPYDAVAWMKTEQVKKVAKKIFFKSMTHLKRSFPIERQKKKLDLKTSRRLIQSIVNLISKDESFMIGMTNIKNYDEYTVNHSANVAVLSLCFGRRLGLEKEELLELGLSAFFHDIGKLGIPKELLEKKEMLTEEERQIMEKHTIHGVEKLLNLKDSSNLPVKALYVALEHHAWTNLTGYPRYWKKDTISMYSKIVKICDFFDSVTTERPYREHVFTREKALNLMQEKSGTEFDPVLINVFSTMLGVYPAGTLVALDTNELAIVTESNPDATLMLRPKVKLITDASGRKIDGELVELTEMDSHRGTYKRTIVKSLNPAEYDVRVSDYFLALD